MNWFNPFVILRVSPNFVSSVDADRMRPPISSVPDAVQYA